VTTDNSNYTILVRYSLSLSIASVTLYCHLFVVFLAARYTMFMANKKGAMDGESGDNEEEQPA